MKLCSCLGAISALTIVLAAPTLSPDASSKHTIWAESTITSMRNSSNAVYEATQFLYNNRGIFDNDAAANCSAGQYDGSNSVCARADALLASTEHILSDAWASLGKSMFPVNYGLPDNNHERRATFGDFSHFYSYMFLEMAIWTNVSMWYVCQGNISGQSASYNGTSHAYFDNNDETTTRFGPLVPCPGHKNRKCIAGNGTDIEYNKSNADWVTSWWNAYELFFYGIYWFRNLLLDEGQPTPPTNCAGIIAAGCPLPVAPKDLWKVHAHIP